MPTPTTRTMERPATYRVIYTREGDATEWILCFRTRTPVEAEQKVRNTARDMGVNIATLRVERR